MWISILKNHFDSVSKDFVPIVCTLHISTKNPQIFNSSTSIIYHLQTSHCYIIYSQGISKCKDLLTSQSKSSTKQIHHLRIFHETSRVLPFSNARVESRINNRQWNVNDRHVSTAAVSTLWAGAREGGRDRECLDLGLREDLLVTSTREFRAKYLFIRLWYA